MPEISKKMGIVKKKFPFAKNPNVKIVRRIPKPLHGSNPKKNRRPANEENNGKKKNINE